MASRTVADVEKVSAEVNSSGHEGLALAARLDSASAAARVVGMAISELGTIDIPVNNVGGFRLIANYHMPYISLSDSPKHEWHWVLDSNLITAFRLCKAVSPNMIERSIGVIIGLASRTVGLVVRSVVLSPF